MGQFILFHKPEKENFEGRAIRTDPGIHCAVADDIVKSVEPGSRILDIGAGEGAFSLRLHKMGYNVRAVDVDDSGFDVPEVLFTKVKPEDNLSDIFGEEQFHAVVAIEVLEHMRSTWKFFDEVMKLLVPGGHLFLTTPNLSSFYSRLVFLKEGRFYHFEGEGSWEMGHINPVPFFVVEQVAKDVGFKLVSRRGVGYMPVLDWSTFKLRNLLMALPRMVLNFMMSGPGPKEGNALFYCFKKSS